MTSFRAAAGSGDDWLSASEECLSALGALSPASNLGIIYASGALAHALDLITARLRDATGIDAWVGTGGTSVCTNAAASDSGYSLSVLTATLPSGGFHLFDGLSDQKAADLANPPEVLRSTAFAIVHGDPRQSRTPDMIEHLGQATGAFLVGGLTSASGNGAMQIAGRPTEGGLSGVLISPDIPMITGLTQGCTPIGPVRQVTGLDGPWVTTLDGQPALDCLKEDVGPVLARSLDRMNGFILAARPGDGADRDDYLVRDLGEVDPLRGFLMIGDDLRKGDSLSFVKRDPEGAKADLRRLIADLRRRAEERSIEAALYHSCIGRGRHLFGDERAELSIIEEELGAIPLSGLHTNGEIFRDRLYGYSAVLTLFLGDEPS